MNRAKALQIMFRDKVSPRVMAEAIARLDAEAPRRPLRPAWQRDVWARSGGKCWYCWTGLTRHDSTLRTHFHCDHVWLLDLGGPDTLENLVPSCAACNIAKGASDLLDWLGGVH